jgi:hypothetical protein
MKSSPHKVRMGVAPMAADRTEEARAMVVVETGADRMDVAPTDPVPIDRAPMVHAEAGDMMVKLAVPIDRAPMVHEVAGDMMAKLAVPMARRRRMARRRADPVAMVVAQRVAVAKDVVPTATDPTDKPVPMVGRRVPASHQSECSSDLI